MADGHLADQHVLVNRKAHLFDGGLSTAGHLVIVERIQTVSENLGDHVALLRFAVEQDVLGRGETRDQRKLLMNHANAGGERVKGRRKVHFFSVQKNLPFVTAGFADHVHAEKDLHQRALAGAVLTAEAEHLALTEREIDVGQHLVAEEVLLDVAHFQ